MGASRELIGRLKTIITINELGYDHYVEILNSLTIPKVTAEFKTLTTADLEFDESVLDVLAKDAISNAYGSRILETRMLELLNKVQFEIIRACKHEFKDSESVTLRISYEDGRFVYKTFADTK